MRKGWQARHTASRVLIHERMPGAIGHDIATRDESVALLGGQQRLCGVRRSRAGIQQETQVGSGDVITENVTRGATTIQTATTLDFVFVTVPALSSYADTAGHSGAITYPEPLAGPGSAFGTATDPIEVAPGPSGDVVVTLTFFRPQRLGISGAGEPQFMDIGHLNYTVSAAPMPSGGPMPRGSGECPAAAYTHVAPPLTLTAGVGHHAAEGTLVDSAADQPASPAITVDLSKCSASALRAGQPTRVDLGATTSHLPTDSTGQTFWVERTG